MYNREIDLKSYIPDYLKDYKEFKVITDLEKEDIEKLRDACDELWNDGFISTAGHQGIKKWETLLGIRTDTGRSLEERRTEVLTSWNKQLPYTEIKLREKLTALLGADYILDIWNLRYELRLIVKERSYPIIKSISRMVKEMIPANLASAFYGRYSAGYTEVLNYNTAVRFQTCFYPRYNLPYLFLDRTWSLNAQQRLNGYNGEETLNFYPLSLTIRMVVFETPDFKKQIYFPLAIQNKQTVMLDSLRLRNKTVQGLVPEERFSFNVQVKTEPAPGQVRVMNRNEADSTWKLSGRRRLNGGQTIL